MSKHLDEYIPLSIVNCDELNITNVSSENNLPHWGWWLFWLIIFWPILLFLVYYSVSNRIYTVSVEYIVKGTVNRRTLRIKETLYRELFQMQGRGG